MSLRKSILALSASAGLSLLAVDAGAVLYGFDNITNNSAVNVESQLKMDVTSVAGNKVSFTFSNAIGIGSSIADIYFDDNNSGGVPSTILGSFTITDSGAGVAFSALANPSNLPGGNTINFVTTSGLSADSDSPVSANGVNTNAESVTLTFNIINGADFNAVISQLNAGQLRVGLHVQSIAGACYNYRYDSYDGGCSDSDGFVNIPNRDPPTRVAEPASLALLASGLAGLGLVRRRRTA